MSVKDFIDTNESPKEKQADKNCCKNSGNNPGSISLFLFLFHCLSLSLLFKEKDKAESSTLSPFIL